MEMPRPVRYAIVAMSLCIAVSLMAAAADWLSGSFVTSEFVFLTVICGAGMLVPVKLANGSDAARYWFLVFVAVIYLNWLRGLSPFPPFTSVALILQIPVVVVLINWLFMTAVTAEWFNQQRKPDAPGSDG